MFSKKTDASKVALVALARHLHHHHFDIIDCQVTTDHLLSMGATEMPRDRFLNILKHSVSEQIPDTVWEPRQQMTLCLN